MIDTGATMLVLPQEIVDELGLRKIREAKVRYANGKAELRSVYGVVTVVDPRTRRLMPNPASPETPMVEILSFKAWPC